MPPTEAPTTFETKSRQVLTFLIVCVSVIGVLVLACVVIFIDKKPDTQLDTAKFVFGSVLPLLASWVGTILAYYFSKENFAAATQSVSDLASKVSGPERLRSVSVQEVMRPLGRIKFMSLQQGQEDGIKLGELDQTFGRVERLLFLN